MISLARKHVLSEDDFRDAIGAIQWISVAVWRRIRDLRGEKVVILPVTSACLTSTAVFEQQSLSPKEQFAVHAKGLVCAVGSPISLGRSDRPHIVRHVQ